MCLIEIIIFPQNTLNKTVYPIHVGKTHISRPQKWRTLYIVKALLFHREHIKTFIDLRDLCHGNAIVVQSLQCSSRNETLFNRVVRPKKNGFHN